MKLTLGEVTLKRLQEGDLEMLRNWRNDPKIRNVMFYQEHISQEMQLNWFKNLGTNDYYFIIETANTAVGLIHLNVDEETPDKAAAGLFIHDDSYWGTPIPVSSSLAILHFAFDEIGLKQVVAKVRKDNSAAIRYNRSLGFSNIEGEYQTMSKDSFECRAMPLYKRLKKKSHPNKLR